MVHTYQDMDEFLSTIVEMEKMLGEIGKTPYEPLQKKEEKELALKETNIDKHFTITVHGFFY